jgi:hypothetical protein
MIWAVGVMVVMEKGRAPIWKYDDRRTPLDLVDVEDATHPDRIKVTMMDKGKWRTSWKYEPHRVLVDVEDATHPDRVDVNFTPRYAFPYFCALLLVLTVTGAMAGGRLMWRLWKESKLAAAYNLATNGLGLLIGLAMFVFLIAIKNERFKPLGIVTSMVFIGATVKGVISNGRIVMRKDREQLQTPYLSFVLLPLSLWIISFSRREFVYFFGRGRDTDIWNFDNFSVISFSVFASFLAISVSLFWVIRWFKLKAKQ